MFSLYNIHSFSFLYLDAKVMEVGVTSNTAGNLLRWCTTRGVTRPTCVDIDMCSVFFLLLNL